MKDSCRGFSNLAYNRNRIHLIPESGKRTPEFGRILRWARLERYCLKTPTYSESLYPFGFAPKHVSPLLASRAPLCGRDGIGIAVGGHSGRGCWDASRRPGSYDLDTLRIERRAGQDLNDPSPRTASLSANRLNLPNETRWCVARQSRASKEASAE